MNDEAGHIIKNVIPEITTRQWVLSFPYKIGAITFIQRFGSALNLNLHFHTLITDGVFIQKKDDTYLFQRLPSPTQEELQILVNKIKIKIERKLQKLNLAQVDQLPFEEESLGDITQLSITQSA